MNRFLMALTAAALVAAAGCGGPKTGTVSGLVKLKGQPLAGGTITFAPVNSELPPVTAAVGPDGRYTAADVPVGELRVGVGSGAAEEDEARSAKEQGKDPRKPAPPKVPAKYADPLTSGLTFTLSGPAGEFAPDLS